MEKSSYDLPAGGVISMSSLSSLDDGPKIGNRMSSSVDEEEEGDLSVTRLRKDEKFSSSAETIL